MWQPSWSCPTNGYFYPPTLFTDVAPSSTVAQVEIFGPVVVLMTFRTPEESVELANNTRYGLAASLWTENINLALDIAPKVKAGTVWINCTNVFDAASGFGGYRESGFGREGGKEGLWEYLKRGSGADGQVGRSSRKPKKAPRAGDPRPVRPSAHRPCRPSIEPQSCLLAASRPGLIPATAWRIKGADGSLLGEVGQGNRKDLRNAVEAAHKASSWARATAHTRAQVIYYLAENLAARAEEFARRLEAMTGRSGEPGSRSLDPPALHLCGMGRQVGWRGSSHAVSQCHPGDAGTDRGNGGGMSRGASAARIHFHRDAPGVSREHGHCDSLGDGATRGHRFLPGHGNIRSPGRGDQHRDWKPMMS